MSDNHNISAVNRENRYSSHTLVELRRFRKLPIGIHSALLLDISLSGFKIEFTSETLAKPGSHYWLSIPLLPLGIYQPKRLICEGECRWFDDKRYRLGGVFTFLTKTDHHLIEQVVEALKKRDTLRS